MKTHSTALSPIHISVLSIGILGILAATFAFSALFARAEVGPEVTTSIHSTSHATTTTASIGSVVHARVAVATSTGSTTPTGTADFSLYQGTSCTGTPTVESGVALAGGVAESASTTAPAAGLSYIAHYNGDADNTPADSTCVALTAPPAVTSLTTSLSATNVTVGSTVNDSAALHGATTDASGTVTYTVYSDNACSQGALAAGAKAVAAGVVPNSDTLQFLIPGTYYWQAVYSGDAHNTTATSTCGSEVLTVTPTSTPQGHIIIDKVTVPAGATTTFNFSVTGGGYSNFSLTDAAAPNNQVLAPGSYSISENAVAGWRLTSATCSINNGTSTAYVPGSTLTLSDGDTITCTFTNTQKIKDGNGGHGRDCSLDDDDGDDHDNGKHKGFLNGLPFGIFKKFDGQFPFSGKFFDDDDDNDSDDDDDSNTSSSVKQKKQKKEKKQKKGEDDD